MHTTRLIRRLVHLRLCVQGEVAFGGGQVVVRLTLCSVHLAYLLTFCYSQTLRVRSSCSAAPRGELIGMLDVSEAVPEYQMCVPTSSQERVEKSTYTTDLLQVRVSYLLFHLGERPLLLLVADEGC